MGFFCENYNGIVNILSKRELSIKMNQSISFYRTKIGTAKVDVDVVSNIVQPRP